MIVMGGQCEIEGRNLRRNLRGRDRNHLGPLISILAKKNEWSQLGQPRGRLQAARHFFATLQVGHMHHTSVIVHNVPYDQEDQRTK